MLPRMPRMECLEASSKTEIEIEIEIEILESAAALPITHIIGRQANMYA